MRADSNYTTLLLFTLAHAMIARGKEILSSSVEIARPQVIVPGVKLQFSHNSAVGIYQKLQLYR